MAVVISALLITLLQTAGSILYRRKGFNMLRFKCWEL